MNTYSSSKRLNTYQSQKTTSSVSPSKSNLKATGNITKTQYEKCKMHNREYEALCISCHQ